jgi:hypothetical protein
MTEPSKTNITEDVKTNSVPDPPRRRRPPKLRKKNADTEETNEQQLDNPKEPSTQDSPPNEQQPDTPKEASTQESPPSEPRGKENMDDTPGDTESIDRNPTTDEAQSSGPELQPEPRQDRAVRRQETVKEDRPDENQAPQRRRRRRRGQQEMVPLGNVDDLGNTVNEAGELVQAVGSKAVNSVGDTAGKVVGGALSSGDSEEKKGKDEQLRLRLDLNLDIEVQLKAKIHGDLTLQLL